MMATSNLFGNVALDKDFWPTTPLKRYSPITEGNRTCLILRYFAASIISISILSLSACGSITVPKTVNVEVPTACIKELPPVPTINTDKELSEMNPYDRYINIRADEISLLDYSGKLFALASPCVR